MHPSLAAASEPSRPLWVADETTWASVSESLPPLARAFARAQGFDAKPGSHCVLPDEVGGLAGVAFGLDRPGARRADPFLIGKLPALLPEGTYRLAGPVPDPELAALAWCLGAYRFERYRKPKGTSVRLVVPEGVDAGEVARIARGRPRARPRQHAGERSRTRRDRGRRARSRTSTGRRSPASSATISSPAASR